MYQVRTRAPRRPSGTRDLVASPVYERDFEIPRNLLRHSHATMLDVVGMPLGTMQSLLGQSSPGITSEIYLHAIPEEQRRAVESAERLLFGLKWTQVQAPTQTTSRRMNRKQRSKWSGRPDLNRRPPAPKAGVRSLGSPSISISVLKTNELEKYFVVARCTKMWLRMYGVPRIFPIAK